MESCMESLKTAKAPQFPSYITLASTHFKTAWSLYEIFNKMNDVFSQLSINAKLTIIDNGANVYVKWSCSCVRNNYCWFDVAISEFEKENVVEFRRMNGSRYAFSIVLNQIATYIDVSIPVLSWWSSPPDISNEIDNIDEMHIDKTINYFKSLVTASQTELKLNGLSGLTNYIANKNKIMNEKVLCCISNMYKTIITYGKSDDQELATAAIICLNKFIDYIVFTPEMCNDMCEIVTLCNDKSSYHVRREALNFTVTLSRKIPSLVRDTGVLTFAHPNEKDSITFQYISDLQDILKL